MEVCATWLARDFLRRAGRPLDETPPCDHSPDDCPPIREGANDMSTVSKLDTTAAEKAAAKHSDTPSVVEVVMHDFLTAAAKHIAAATDPAEPNERFATHCALSQAYGLVAYVLNAYHQSGEDSTELAWELTDLLANGEPLDEWVREQLTARGVNVDEITAS
jgi:hypothetical protein